MSREVLETIASGRSGLCLCTVVEVKGSAPRHVGSRMLAGGDGWIAGSVGGGLVEARALEAGRHALATGRSLVLEVEMRGTDAEGPELVCGGVTRILVEPLPPAASYRHAVDLASRGERALLVKRVPDGETAVLGEDGEWTPGPLEGADAGALLRHLGSGQARFLEGPALFLDPVLPREKLLILGGGHVGRALAAVAAPLGFAVTVADDRAEFLEPARLPFGVETRLGSFSDVVAAFPFDLATYAVIVTRGHACDLECARAVLPRPHRYAGLMASRRKTRILTDRLLADGLDPARVDSLRTPIGLAIGAETPEELAISIAGELVAVRHGAARPVAREAASGTP